MTGLCRKEEIGMAMGTKDIILTLISGVIFIFTVAATRNMGAAIIAGIIRRFVFVVFDVLIRSVASVSVAKNRRALGTCY